MRHEIQETTTKLVRPTELSTIDLSQLTKQAIKLNKQSSETVFYFEEPVYIIPQSGLAQLLFTKELNEATVYETQLLETVVFIQEKVYFNALALTAESQLTLLHHNSAKPQLLKAKVPLIAKHLPQHSKLETIYAIENQIKSSQTQFEERISHYYKLVIVSQGQLNHHINGRHYITQKNDAILYRPGEVYQVETSEQNITQYLSILFQASNLPEHLYEQVHHLSQEALRLVDDIHLRANLQANDRPYLNDMVYANVYHLLLLLSEQGSSSEDSDSSMAMRENYERELFQAMATYIENHVEEKNEVQDLVEEFDISRSTVQSLFKKYSQLTPKQYINQVRLQRSKDLIHESSLTLSEIAHDLGYGSIQYFSRAFTKEFGLTPSAYAKRIRQVQQ
ncbi:helix-turn-helix domain-containing protein [Suicoccus acidiformans]|uniref:helix-turn-helix domain-containing protein n=1 Tax=Suicoccus acidiformans TaxID=2036206 RepID=UPI0013C2B446|nr:AraC family transcriptional regulator [Suicoccus acidiformans]